MLEQEFTWLCLQACNITVHATKKSFSQRSVSERLCGEVVQKHRALLQKGFNLTKIPSISEINDHHFPRLIADENLQFLADFICETENTNAGSLAQYLINENYVDLNKCKLEAEPHVGYYTGQPIRFKVIPSTQYGDVCMNTDLNIQVVVKKGTVEDDETDFGCDSTKLIKLLTNLKQIGGYGSASEEEERNKEYYKKMYEQQMVGYNGFLGMKNFTK